MQLSGQIALRKSISRRFVRTRLSRRGSILFMVVALLVLLALMAAACMSLARRGREASRHLDAQTPAGDRYTRSKSRIQVRIEFVSSENGSWDDYHDWRPNDKKPFISAEATFDV